MKPLHILHVEDNEGDIMLIHDAIREGGIAQSLDVVRDGYQALQFLNKEGPYKDKVTPNLILLDINMPIMNGHELLDQLKSNDLFKHIPVIMLTTSSSKSDIMKSYQKYSNSFIIKPGSSEDLEKMVRDIGSFWSNIAELPSG